MMKTVKRIAVVADVGSETNALRRALEIAQKTKATVVLLGFVYDSAVELGTQLTRVERKKMIERLVTARTAELNKMIQAQRKFAINVQTQVIWTKQMSVWLCDNIRGLAADLVIKTSHPSRRPLYLPSDWYLMRELSIPLWLVYPEPTRRRNEVMALIDASNLTDAQHNLNRTVLRSSQQMATILDATVSASYVREISSLPIDFDVVDERPYVQKHAKIAADSLSHELRLLSAHKEVVPLSAAGQLAEALPTLIAKRKPKLVVFGTAARRGVARFFFGNTAERVIPLLECDVLIVKNTSPKRARTTKG